MTHKSIAERIIGSMVQAGSPAVSPDGRTVAFVVTATDLDKNTYRSQIWLAAADGSSPPRVLTSGDHDGQPAWSADGSSLVFTSSRSPKKGESTLHVIPIDRPGEVRTVATMPDGISDVRPSRDGRWIAFTSRTQDERYKAEDESWQAPRKVERFFGRLDNEGWIFDRPQHVYVVASDATTAPRNLTPGPFQHGGVSWTADSSAIVTSAQRHDNWDLDFANDLYLVGLDGTVSAITKQTGSYGWAAASPTDDRVAFIGGDDPGTVPQNMHVGIVAATGGDHHWSSRGTDRTFECTAGIRPPVWESPFALLSTMEDRGTTNLVRVTVDGSAAPAALTSGPITVKAFDASAGTIVYIAGAVDEVSDLFVLRDGGSVRLTDFAARYRAAASPLTWERFAVPAADGTVDIDAWIMRPVDFDEHATYPVLLDVHGGPHTQYGEALFDEAQFQAAAGFVVLMSNPRGSSGREQSWGQSIMGPKHPTAPGSGWGSVDVDDVLAVLDTALSRYPFCDRERVGMIGGSYGGYMATMLAAKHGSKFKAICSERSVNNMISEEWTSDIGSIFKVEHGLSHLEDPAQYIAISPVTYVRDIHVPMLLLHSENDLRCPISQAEELFMALRLLGRDVTFYRFPGEGHELTRSGSPVHRVQRAEIVLDWFAAHLAPAD